MFGGGGVSCCRGDVMVVVSVLWRGERREGAALHALLLLIMLEMEFISTGFEERYS